MGHGWYNIVQPMGHGVVRVLYGPWVMGGTTSMTHGLYNIVRCCMAHGSWGFCRIVWPMGHGEKVAEGAHVIVTQSMMGVRDGFGGVGKSW